MIKIVIYTNSTILSNGLSSLLEESSTYTVSSVCTSIEQVKMNVSRSKASLVVVVPQLLPVRQIQDLETLFGKVCVVALVYQYIEQNALQLYHGIIEINDSLNKIEYTFRLALERSSSSDNNEQDATDNNDLSDREKEVLILIAKGLTNKDIAENMNLSIFTVITHRRNIISKTGIKSVAGLTVYALMNNMIDEKDIIFESSNH